MISALFSLSTAYFVFRIHTGLKIEEIFLWFFPDQPFNQLPIIGQMHHHCGFCPYGILDGIGIQLVEDTREDGLSKADIDTGYYDEIMKAKIYPKIVYYYLKKQILFKEYWNVETQTENLKICE